jgi:hypothetical protein
MRTVELEALQNELAEYVRAAGGGGRLLTPPLSPGRGLTVEHPRNAKLKDLLAELTQDRKDR